MNSRSYLISGLVCLSLLSSAPVFAQTTGGPKLGELQTHRVKVGMTVSARSGPCRGIVATSPVPTDWPEQVVEVIEEQVSPFAKINYRMVAGTVKQLVVEIPMLPAGEEAEVMLTLEIRRQAIAPPDDTSVYIIPKKLDKQTRLYLGGSPFIESRHPKIRSLAKETMAGKETTWEQVAAFHQWIRENVKVQDGPLKGGFRAMKDGSGSHEDISSLFIALCRVSGIPARTVWVPGSSYAEFYLEDDGGQGHWFPCEVTGPGEFGTAQASMPIYQKGDNFRVPERPRDPQRYVSEFLTGAGGQPKVKFVREISGAGL